MSSASSTSKSPSLQSASSPSPLPVNPEVEQNHTAKKAETENVTEEQARQWGIWLEEVLKENPQFLPLRERLLPWTGGYSFANVVHSDSQTTSAHINRYSTLELIYQHLTAIGMHQTAKSLEKETGLQFQNIEQPWDKTDLLLLLSSGVLPREDPWGPIKESHHSFTNEILDEDFYSSPYVESYRDIYKEIINPDFGVIYEGSEKSFQSIKAASLRRIVVSIIIYKVTGDELNKIFLIINSFTSTYHFFQHLAAVYNADKCQMSEEDRAKLMKGHEFNQIQVINVIRSWINFHGLFISRRTLKAIDEFLRKIISERQSDSIVALAKALLDAIPTAKSGSILKTIGKPTVQPIIDNQQILFKPSLTILEPNPTEVARQVTLVFHDAYKKIHSREFVVALGDRAISQKTSALSEFFEIGRKFQLQILEAIVCATDKSKAISQVLTLCSDLNTLGNYDALSWIIKILEREELRNYLVKSDPNSFEKILQLDICAGVNANNKDEYATTLLNRFGKREPTIPNMQTEVKSIKPDSSPSYINGLINLKKRRPFAEKLAVLYRFQNQPYNFYTVSQIKKVIERGATLSETEILEKLSKT
ncbi:RasGEF domain containing protein [Histomonas meleagridis]|uniref:RasGEF domain containing protein n=1 Tax=Histomonas meleagridis TaxID=135588 RepID=UPI00355AB24A|nr:RasGEF domain containing protein [Histomonas meleagridis]KAH0800450.1 RasGEF domain containing protein [Histomonas meleagridis]